MRQFERWFIPYALKAYCGNERGARLLREITPALINDFIHGKCGHLAQATRHTYRRTISKVFNALIREGSFKGPNPVASSRPVPLPRHQAKRSVWIPEEHHMKIVAAAEKSRSTINIRDLIELNWELALRVDEALTLEWHQIDFEKRVLRIINKPSFPTEFGMGWSPKWGRERILPLTPKAIEILKRQPKRLSAGRIGKTSKLAPTNLVFPMRKPWEGELRYLRCNSLKHAWTNVVCNAGLAEFGYQWHDMRRSWNRLAAEKGIPVSYRAAFLGHREEVNESNYETQMSLDFMFERMGSSMSADTIQNQKGAVRVLFESAFSENPNSASY